MYFEVNKEEVKRAQFPHNLLIFGLFAFNLFMAPAVIVLHIGMQGLLAPLFCTCALVGYIYQRSKNNTNPFITAHWRLALSNSKWLMLGYAVSATLILIAWLISQASQEVSMKHILWTALTRIGLLPTLFAVMATAMMEASAISLASKQEVPDKLVASNPPPAT